jgi:hypothetical protein
MNKYIYQLNENTTVETFDITSIPEGVEYQTEEYIEVIDTQALINEALQIDLYYTEIISDLLRKHIEKLSIDGIPIPQDVIDERDRLRAECNQKIIDLGITNFSYRQSNLKL